MVRNAFFFVCFLMLNIPFCDGQVGFKVQELISSIEPHTRPVSSTIGDFNGDGKLDIVIGTQRSVLGPPPTAYLLCYLQNDSGGFAEADTIVYFQGPQNSPYLLHMASGDVTGDGKEDLLLSTTQENGILLFEQNDSNSLVQTQIIPLRSSARLFELAHIHSSTKLDIVVSQNEDEYPYRDSILIFSVLGNGDLEKSGGFIGPNVNVSGADLAIADYNNDGLVDIAAMGVIAEVTGSSSIFVYLQQTNLSFGPPLVLVHPHFHINFISVGDYNNDGLQDLCASTRGYEHDFLDIWCQPFSNFDSASIQTIPKVGIRALVTGSFNCSDQTDDVLVLSESTSYILQQGANGMEKKWSQDSLFVGAISVNRSQLDVADINGDGMDDLSCIGDYGAVVAFNSSNLLIRTTRLDSFTIDDFAFTLIDTVFDTSAVAPPRIYEENYIVVQVDTIVIETRHLQEQKTVSKYVIQQHDQCGSLWMDTIYDHTWQSIDTLQTSQNTRIFSTTDTIWSEVTDSLIFDLYPNPTQGELKWTTNANTAEPLDIVVLDIRGTILYEESAVGSIKLDLPSGVYLVQVKPFNSYSRIVVID